MAKTLVLTERQYSRSKTVLGVPPLQFLQKWSEIIFLYKNRGDGGERGGGEEIAISEVLSKSSANKKTTSSI